MKKKSSRKKWLVATAAFALLAIGAGTFAWFQSKDNVTNHFEGELAGNDVEIVEQFVPKPWKPGDAVEKKVAVANIGEYDSMIRVSLKETLAKLKNAEAQLTDDATKLDGKTEADIYLMPLDVAKVASGYTPSVVADTKFTVTGGYYAGTYTLKVQEKEINTAADGTKTYSYVSYWDNGTKQYYAKTNGFNRATDGTLTPQTAQFKYVDLERAAADSRDWAASPIYTPTLDIKADGTANVESGVDNKIELNFVNLSSTGTAGKWTYNTADGYFYYIGIVGSQAQTAPLLNSVTLLNTADNTYSKLSYDLDVNARSIQAEKEAVDSTDWLNATNATIKTALEGLY